MRTLSLNRRMLNDKFPAEREGFRSGRRTVPAKEVQTVFAVNSILVPIDFSAGSEKALASAVPLAHRFGAKLTLLHVVEPAGTPDFDTSFPLLLDEDKLKGASRDRLEQIVKDGQVDPKLIEKTLVRFGRAFNEIVHAAKTLKVDLIIISTHGYTGLKHALLGSTTERVVRHASCPVLVVRSHEDEKK